MRNLLCTCFPSNYSLILQQRWPVHCVQYIQYITPTIHTQLPNPSLLYSLQFLFRTNLCLSPLSWALLVPPFSPPYTLRFLFRTSLCLSPTSWALLVLQYSSPYTHAHLCPYINVPCPQRLILCHCSYISQSKEFLSFYHFIYY